MQETRTDRSARPVRWLRETPLCGVAILGVLLNWALLVNGKPSDKAPIEQNGEIYIPVSALKAAGAQVTYSGGRISIRFLPFEGGSQQIDAIEGGLNERLFNGIWRMQIVKVEPCVDPFDPNRPGYALTFEVNNGTSKSTSPFATGVQYPQLVDENETALKVDEGAWQTRLQMKELLPSGGVTATISFYYPHGTPDTTVKPVKKLVVPIDPSFGPLRDTGLKYSVKAPSFRIWLNNRNSTAQPDEKKPVK